MESLVDSDHRVKSDDGDFDQEVDAVENCLGVIPGWMCDWAWHITRSRAESSSESKENRRNDQDVHLRPEASLSELLDLCVTGNDIIDDQQRKWKEGCNSEVCLPDQLDSPIDPSGTRVECVETLHSCGD